MKEKVVCENLYQLAESVRLATPLARFGKVDRSPAICVATLNNPEISGRSGRMFWQNCILGHYSSASYLASLVQKAFVASLLSER
jgi:hypothetical protein